MKSTAGAGARVFACASMLFLLLAGASTAFAQRGVNAIITGTVTDNVGVVPGATVTVSNPAIGLVRTASSTGQGAFRFVSLAPGIYTVSIEMTGFKKIELNITLLAGETRDLGTLTMTAGGVTETVNVTAEVTPVQTASSSLQKNLRSDMLIMLQVKGRDIFGMLAVLPGVVDTGFLQRDYSQWRSGRYLSVNGGDSLHKNTTIDGVPVGEEGGGGTTHVTPNLDSVAEVNVVTNGYTAEHGRMMSGVVAMVIKSGTTQFRGSGWYVYRRDDLNKNDYFRIKQKAAKPFFAVDIAGYSIGGPVIVPKVIDSRTSEKKAFFFLSQEFTDDIKPSAISRANLPTALERNGDFSQTFIGSATANPDGTISGTKNLATLTNPFGASAPDFFLAPNVINPKYFSSMGRAMLSLLPLPNNKLNPQPGQANNANDAQDALPTHTRKNTVLRVDTVLSQHTRFSGRVIVDRDYNTTWNRTAPGIGSLTNTFPGNFAGANLTQVLRSTVVNEMTVGYSANHYGWIARPGKLVASDYTQFYRQNVGLDPPRIAPSGAYGEPHLGRIQLDQYPYLPDMLYAGGSRANLSAYRPMGGGAALPVWNANRRYTFQDDLSIAKGRHAFKFGFAIERDSKTEPGSGTNGSYNFGHSGDNPLSTGNGYANALIGVFTSYSEQDRRNDHDRVHWLADGYAQDTWRVSPRFTLDYGLRVTHAGTIYDTRNMNSAFDPALWKANQASALYRPHCLTGVPGNVTCASANRRAINPLTGQVVSQFYVATLVPGSGDINNGFFTGGLPGKGRAEYFSLVPLSWGPRVGVAWDVSGNGKTAIRASTGMFYNLPQTGYYGIFLGGPQISRSRTIYNSTIGDIVTISGSGNLVEGAPGAGLPDGFPMTLYGKQQAPGDLQPEKSYQVNVAFQRDIGFHTTAEAAYVGNFGRKRFSFRTTNNIPVYAYGNPANLFNNEAINPNFIRRNYPGMGVINVLDTDQDFLNYNAFQLNVQRRMTKGLQMGLAYTFSKAMGIQGYDFATEELYGEQGLRDRYYGPWSTFGQQDRRHNLVISYTYQIPTPLPTLPVVKHVLAGWEASGIIQFITGDAVTPSCGTTQGGIANSDPTLTGVAFRCELTGAPILSGYTVDPSLAVEDRPHFNLAAFQRPLPNGAIGNFGNSPLGILRNPSWSNWDFTLARRVPIKLGRGGNVRVQLQFYNLFNQVEFDQMNASFSFSSGNNAGNTNTNTGKYTRTRNPFNMGITIRADY